MIASSHPLRNVAVSAGALGAGGLAALLGACCGVPWLVSVVGVGGAIAVARLAFLAPYLWLVAFGFAMAALVWAHRPEAGCDVACAPTQRRRRQLAAWLITLVMLGLLVAVRGWQSLVF